MVNSHDCCDPQFKKHIKHRHRKCHKDAPTKLVSGKKLNAFFKIGLKDDKS